MKEENLRPVVLVWNGNEPLTVLETILFDEIEKIVNYWQIHQFLSIDLAENFMDNHKNLRHLKPQVIVIWHPAKENQIEEFFFQYNDCFSSKMVFAVSNKCAMPNTLSEHNEFLVLEDLGQQEPRLYLEKILGTPLDDKLPAEDLMAKSAVQ